MASKRMIRREKKRVALQQRYRSKRKELRAQLNDPNVGIEVKFAVLEKIEKLRKDTNPIRSSRRCRITGRARGVYRKFGLCRNELRRRAMAGEIPGLVMASW